MELSDNVRGHAEKPLIIASSDITNHDGHGVMSADVTALDGKLLADYRPSLVIGTALFVSGIVHLTLLWVTGADWSGPLSLRKPGLFGVSAGVTVWSIAWVLTQFVPRHNDQRWATVLSGALLLEVGLITLQQWRGVPSHFNRETTLDATIEFMMLGLILLITVGIAWLWRRSRDLLPMHESRVIAIRAGLWLLLVSCGLGLLVTLAGELNLANGRPPEVQGRAGVLKYPHGAVLHAIQTLPLLSSLLLKLKVSYSAWLLRSAVAAHLSFLIHALWQTFNGRARMDLDSIGGATLAVAGLLLLLPLVAIVCRIVLMVHGCGAAMMSVVSMSPFIALFACDRPDESRLRIQPERLGPESGIRSGQLPEPVEANETLSTNPIVLALQHREASK